LIEKTVSAGRLKPKRQIVTHSIDDKGEGTGQQAKCLNAFWQYWASLRRATEIHHRPVTNRYAVVEIICFPFARVLIKANRIGNGPVGVGLLVMNDSIFGYFDPT
jgi:hypothetical protein